MTIQAISILLLTDNADFMRFIQQGLSGHRVILAETVVTALVALHQYHPQLILLDMRILSKDTTIFLEIYCRQLTMQIPLIAIISQESRYTAYPCITEFVANPQDADALMAVIRKYLSPNH